MRMYDLIAKKRDGLSLTGEEIDFIIRGFTNGDIPDYQMSAFLMAVYLRGMTDEETARMTLAMAHSGDMVDLSGIEGVKADKHSTGGVGDKTTLVVAPVVASCGVKIAKMSGRGLGHTGGTVDKMESVPGCRTSLPSEEFIAQVNRIGISVVGQSRNLAPADKKMYALRDVTATIASVPLIASSIMSKKLAAGADCILLDVKTGNGAFMKTLDDSIALARAMVAIGTHNGRKVAALVTDMDTPLGPAVGNSLEVAESMQVLRGCGPADLTTVCRELASNLLMLAGKGTLEECRALFDEAISSGRAFETCKAMFAAQGGDVSVLEDGSFRKAKYSHVVRSPRGGWVRATNTEQIGIASVMLGAGRTRKEDPINFAAGIVLNKKAGDAVQPGEALATLYADDESLFDAAAQTFLAAYTFGDEAPVLPPLVMARVTESGVERF